LSVERIPRLVFTMIGKNASMKMIVTFE